LSEAKPDRDKDKKKMRKPYYEIQGDKLIPRLKTCPRCGCFMAKHSDRLACGGCGFAEFIRGKKDSTPPAPSGP